MRKNRGQELKLDKEYGYYILVHYRDVNSGVWKSYRFKDYNGKVLYLGRDWSFASMWYNTHKTLMELL